MLNPETVPYSHYKGGNTMKVVIGVSPAGLITRVSDPRAGRSSDKSPDRAVSTATAAKIGDVKRRGGMFRVATSGCDCVQMLQEVSI